MHQQLERCGGGGGGGAAGGLTAQQALEALPVTPPTTGEAGDGGGGGGIKSKVIGIYFSASWCGPCQRFTPRLAECYRALRARNAAFEVVFVSADREEADFKAYCEKMPWLALPFGARDIRSLLNDMLGIGGIPTLMLLDGEGGLISMDGVRLVSEDGAGERFPWSLDAVVGTLQPKLALLKGQTYTSASLAAAVERCDGDDDANGDFETIQRSGTCYFRCVLTCFKYLLKSEGMGAAKRKAFFHLLRLGFLDAVEADLQDSRRCRGFQDSDRRMIELACTQSALSAVKQQRTGGVLGGAAPLASVQAQVERIAEAARAVPVEDGVERGSMWLDMAGSATARLVPFHGFELLATVGGTLVECVLPTQALRDSGLGLEFGPGAGHLRVASVAEGGAAAAAAAGGTAPRAGYKLRAIGGAALGASTPRAEVEALLDAAVQAAVSVGAGAGGGGAAPPPLSLHFEASFSTEGEAWAGGLTEANPPLFVDMMEPDAESLTSWAACAKHIAKCRQSCDDIRKKTCATSVVLNQVCALVEHTFAEVLPLPLPRGGGGGGGGGCVWAPEAEAERPGCVAQLRCLEDLRQLALIYGASSFSNAHDRSTDSLRAVTMGALFAIFDATLRIPASDGASVVSAVVSGQGGSQQPYWPSTLSFDRLTFTQLSERMLLYTPGALHARRALIQYFEASAEAVGGAPKLFDWEIEKARSGGMAMFGGGDDEPNYKIMEDDTTLAFVRTCLEQLGVQVGIEPSVSILESVHID
jgi:thiol-disulfide isomerase/thioredoxin